MRTEQREVTTPSIWAGFRLAKMSTKEVRCKTCTGIAEFLKSNWVPTPSGKSCKWTKNTVYSILTNEKYKGDALLQKKYTADYLEYRMVTNNGELPQYYVEKNHHAIIKREVREMVQTEMVRRSMIGADYSGNSRFASKLICGDCGKQFIRAD